MQKKSKFVSPNVQGRQLLDDASTIECSHKDGEALPDYVCISEFIVNYYKTRHHDSFFLATGDKTNYGELGELMPVIELVGENLFQNQCMKEVRKSTTSKQRKAASLRMMEGYEYEEEARKGKARGKKKKGRNKKAGEEASSDTSRSTPDYST